MKTSKTIIVALFTAVLFLIYSNVIAQEEETKETPYWYVGSFRVPWAKVDSLQKLVKEYTIPVVAEAKKRGTILDYHLLIHHTGGEYNVVIMTKFPSWAAIDEGAGFRAVFETIELDKAKRDSVRASFNWVFESATHKDNIYREATHQP